MRARQMATQYSWAFEKVGTELARRARNLGAIREMIERFGRVARLLR